MSRDAFLEPKNGKEISVGQVYELTMREYPESKVEGDKLRVIYGGEWVADMAAEGNGGTLTWRAKSKTPLKSIFMEGGLDLWDLVRILTHGLELKDVIGGDEEDFEDDWEPPQAGSVAADPGERPAKEVTEAELDGSYCSDEVIADWEAKEAKVRPLFDEDYDAFRMANKALNEEFRQTMRPVMTALGTFEPRNRMWGCRDVACAPGCYILIQALGITSDDLKRALRAIAAEPGLRERVIGDFTKTGRRDYRTNIVGCRFRGALLEGEKNDDAPKNGQVELEYQVTSTTKEGTEDGLGTVYLVDGKVERTDFIPGDWVARFE